MHARAKTPWRAPDCKNPREIGLAGCFPELAGPGLAGARPESDRDPAGGSGEREGTGARKGLLADLLWRRLVVSLEWLAQKLRMRPAANVSQQLRRLDKKRALGRVPEAPKDSWKK